MICLSTTATSIDDAVLQVASQRPYIDAVELRVDLLAGEEQRRLGAFPRLLAERDAGGLPVVCTVRTRGDGGRYDGDERPRLEMLRLGIGSGFAYVDLERRLRDSETGRDLARLAAARKVRVIRSVHAMDGMPDRLAPLLRDLGAGGREIAKVAVTPRGVADLLSIVRAADATRSVRKILIGMGDHGLPTRVLAARFGSVFTFSSVPGDQAAPGHLPPRTLVDLYRYPELRGSTPLFALIGNPVSHSRSPDYHNRRFREDGLEAVYVPIRVDDVAAFFDLSRELPLLGFSVTIPHKQEVIHHLASVDDTVRATGACNTVVRAVGGYRGTNTDVRAFIEPLEPLLAGRSGAHALVLGAGGVARSVCWSLLGNGVSVTVWNRSPDRAARLAADLSRLCAGTPACRAAGAGALPAADLVVNATSVGMEGEVDPAPWLVFSGREIVCDVVYTPPLTAFIRRAIAAGCRTVTGDLMFEAQAAAQYRLYRDLATTGSADA